MNDLHEFDPETTRGAGSLNAPRPGFTFYVPDNRPRRWEKALLIGSAILMIALLTKLFFDAAIGA